MEHRNRSRLERLDEEQTANQKREDRVAFVATIMDKTPILRKSSGPCKKVMCLDCHNYDSDRTVGYTCLIKGTSREDPTLARVCYWFIAKGQTRLGTVGAP